MDVLTGRRSTVSRAVLTSPVRLIALVTSQTFDTIGKRTLSLRHREIVVFDFFFF